MDRFDFSGTTKYLSSMCGLDELKDKVLESSLLLGTIATYENGGDVAEIAKCLSDLSGLVASIKTK